jgi:hypothetical protein
MSQAQKSDEDAEDYGNLLFSSSNTWWLLLIPSSAFSSAGLYRGFHVIVGIRDGPAF